MDPDDAILDEPLRFMQSQRYDEALELLQTPISNASPSWNALYLAGQCHRFLNNFDSAVSLLSRAAAAAPAVAPVFLALGIAFQMGGRLSEARDALARALEIEPDYALAFNSLAMTQKLAGEFEKSVHNYDAGCKALVRTIVKAMRNDRGSPILKHRDTRGTLWMDHALYGAMYLVALDDGLSGMAMPTGEQATEEERTERHGGLYWEDRADENGETVRLFFPNFFNTVRDAFGRDQTYSTLIGNRSTVLKLLGRATEAREHRAEALEFLP
ncbi:MAG: tetratricopeptide repeat protein [Acidobacteriota bacterium]